MRVLLLAEAVTLAHVGRMLTLARELVDRECSVELALAGTDREYPAPCVVHRLAGIGSRAFTAALRRGAPVLTAGTLEQCVQADIALLRSVQPDLVIGDFRLSLSVSARKVGVPYATLTNAYWSPSCLLPLPMPVLPLTRLLPLWAAQPLFDLGKRFVLPGHCDPMNQVRQAHGTAGLGSDLRAVYTDADHVLFADPAGLFPMSSESRNQHFLGPVSWSPGGELPHWWSHAVSRPPLVYVSMGSSGDPAVLRRIVVALAGMPVTAIVSSAGADVVDDLSASNVFHARYLPGDKACEVASLVICNGGSMGCQQALMAGVPVLGIPSNKDQFLNMAPIISSGAGLQLRADRITQASLREAVRQLLDVSAFKTSAEALGKRMRESNAGQQLFELLPSLVTS